jgi:hypothetical protein
LLGDGGAAASLLLIYRVVGVDVAIASTTSSNQFYCTLVLTYHACALLLSIPEPLKALVAHFKQRKKGKDNEKKANRLSQTAGRAIRMLQC